MKPYQNRIVVKVGTSTLTNELGKSDLRCFDRLACVLSDIQNMGYEVILVSSGAIAVGRNKLKMKTQPTSMRHKQAAAAVGQCSIMFLYDKFFGDYDKTIGQILLNAEDIEQEEKKDNLINTFDALLEMGVIPIVNENDTVSTEEIEFGDNDTLSAVVTAVVEGDLLILLTDIDGLYTDDPHKNPMAKLISEVPVLDEKIGKMAKGAVTKVGTGGMETKIAAANIVTDAGADMVIVNSDDLNNVNKVVAGEEVGTLFLAHKRPDFDFKKYLTERPYFKA